MNCHIAQIKQRHCTDVNNKKLLIKILLRFWSMFYFTVVVFTSFSDLYRGADVLSKELPNSHKPPLTGMSWIQALLTTYFTITVFTVQ